MKTVEIDIRELKAFRDNLVKLQNNMDKVCELCAKEITARLLTKVIKRTPVGKYKKGSGKVGGTLRRGWTAQASGSGSEGLETRGASQYVDTLKVHRFGDMYVIEIINPVKYASYVEYGHRTVNHKGWVNGRFMMTMSVQELQSTAPQIVERKIYNFLKEAF